MKKLTYEDVTIDDYIKAKFKNDFSVIPKEDFDNIEVQYIDTSGLYETEEFSKIAYIHYLNNRKNSISLSIRLQTEFLNVFGKPYIPELVFFKKFGYNIVWKDSAEIFFNDLKKIQDSEKKYTSRLENEIKELIKLREKKQNSNESVSQTRHDFISTIISLGKIGYKIDKNTTTLEEFSLMIKKQNEEAEAFKKSKKQ